MDSSAGSSLNPQMPSTKFAELPLPSSPSATRCSAGGWWLSWHLPSQTPSRWPMSGNRTTSVGRPFLRGNLGTMLYRGFSARSGVTQFAAVGSETSNMPRCGWLGQQVPVPGQIFTCCNGHFESSWLGSEVPRPVQSAARQRTHPKTADRIAHMSLKPPERGTCSVGRFSRTKSDNGPGTQRACGLVFTTPMCPDLFHRSGTG